MSDDCDAIAYTCWTSIHQEVRRRLEEWFDAAPADQFQVYLAEVGLCDHEQGSAGVIVTNQRVVFCNEDNRGSVSLDGEGELQIKKTGTSYDVTFCHGRRMRHRRPVSRLDPDDAGRLIHTLDELKRHLRTVRR